MQHYQPKQLLYNTMTILNIGWHVNKMFHADLSRDVNCVSSTLLVRLQASYHTLFVRRKGVCVQGGLFMACHHSTRGLNAQYQRLIDTGGSLFNSTRVTWFTYCRTSPRTHGHTCTNANYLRCLSMSRHRLVPRPTTRTRLATWYGQVHRLFVYL